MAVATSHRKQPMPQGNDYTELPDNLPEPVDDGAADHLPGAELPPVRLPSTSGEHVTLSELSGRTVVYCYTLTGRPDQDVVPDGWSDIPGARGCTPQSCAFRDHHAEIRSLGANVYGLSVQRSAYQREAKERLHLPFELLSDSDFEFTEALDLPTFEADGQTYIKRTTLIVKDACVEKVFYPVFPPNENAAEVTAWLQKRQEELS